MPDGMVIEEINTLLDRITPPPPSLFFFSSLTDCLTLKKATLTVKDTVLSIGKTIARQLRGSEAFAFLLQLPELNLRSFNICFSKRTTW